MPNQQTFDFLFTKRGQRLMNMNLNEHFKTQALEIFSYKITYSGETSKIMDKKRSEHVKED
jgi:hypothetical protein